MRRAGIQESNASLEGEGLGIGENHAHEKKNDVLTVCGGCPKGSYEMLENEWEGQTNKKDRRTVLIYRMCQF